MSIDILRKFFQVEASAKYTTVDTCEQKFALIPAKLRFFLYTILDG